MFHVFWYKNTCLEAKKEEIKKRLFKVLVEFDTNDNLKEEIF